MYPLFVFGSLGLTVALAWATYQSGRLLRSIPVRENLLLAPVENMVKAILVLLCIGLGALSGAPPEQLGWTLDNGWRDLGLGILVGLAAIFGLMHSPQGVLGVILTGVLGMWLSLLFLWSGGLILPLVAHYVINFLQLLKAQAESAWLETY